MFSHLPSYGYYCSRKAGADDRRAGMLGAKKFIVGRDLIVARTSPDAGGIPHLSTAYINYIPSANMTKGRVCLAYSGMSTSIV